MSNMLGVKVEAGSKPSDQSLPPLILASRMQRLTRFPRSSRQTQPPTSSDIAVIGMSSRFPGANDLEGYWQLLLEGRTAIAPMPQERWRNSHHIYAGVLNSISYFDPSFFLIPIEDASAMDPQALLVLEESLNLFYHSGYSLEEIRGMPIAVYLGARTQHEPDQSDLLKTRNPIKTVGQNYLASNISQFFDLKGPSLVVDTACSSALVAMNLAVQALTNGEISSAVVGGISLLTHDRIHRLFHQRNLLSQKSKFHVFDQRASGLILGEGVGLVLLKTLDQALKDADHIYAIIKALAVNNDGRTAGPATPNIHAQKEVMQMALARSGINPKEVDHIEANGSGSEVTDLLELKAIESIYRSSSMTPCSLGSIKPNIGHPLCAEGIASFIKLALMLGHQQFVPFISGEHSMTHYNMEASPFTFYRKPTPWAKVPQIGSLNCFADGGTNAHLIVQSWHAPKSRPPRRKPIPPPKLNRVDICGSERVTKKNQGRDSWWEQESLLKESQQAPNHPIGNISKEELFEVK